MTNMKNGANQVYCKAVDEKTPKKISLNCW